MIGLSIAVIYFLFNLLIEKPLLVIFKKTANFLYWWYLIVAIVMITGFTILSITSSTTIGLLLGGYLGGIIGVGAGSTIAFILIIAVVLAYILEIIGAFLIRESLALNFDGTHKWNFMRLGIGIVCLIIGLIFFPPKS